MSYYEIPRHAVCGEVLNLFSQDGFRLISSALAYAYRVTSEDKNPFKLMLAQNLKCHITNTAGHNFYTTIQFACIDSSKP